LGADATLTALACFGLAYEEVRIKVNPIRAKKYFLQHERWFLQK